MSEEGVRRWSRGPVYWYRPLSLSHEEGEALINGDQRVITTKEGSAISTYEKLTEGMWHAGIFHGEKTYLFPMEQIIREGGHVKIQLGEPRLVMDPDEFKSTRCCAQTCGGYPCSFSEGLKTYVTKGEAPRGTQFCEAYHLGKDV